MATTRTLKAFQQFGRPFDPFGCNAFSVGLPALPCPGVARYGLSVDNPHRLPRALGCNAVGVKHQVDAEPILG